MRWATYRLDGATASGVVIGDSIHPEVEGKLLDHLLDDGIEALDQAGSAAAAHTEGAVSLSEVELLTPFTPRSMRDAMCFHEHVRNAMGVEEIDERHTHYPTFYISNSEAALAPSADVKISPGCEMFDFELEVCAVLGSTAANVPTDEAESHIAGYTMYIDWSARDLQMKEMELRLGPAKGKDGATTIGPFFVTADEFEERRSGKGFDVSMQARVNGDLVTDGNWNSINWTFADVITYTSRGTVLRPRDVLGSGTVGRGCLLEHYRIGSPAFKGWLKPGDVVEFDVDLIGKMSQTVRESDTRHPLSSGH